MAKKNYYLSKDKSKIIVDMKNLKKEEKDIVQMYVNAGKELVPKRTGKERITKDLMKETLKDDTEGLKILTEKLDKKENFMRIVSWYRGYIKEHPIKEEE